MEKTVRKYFPVFALPTLVAFTVGFLVPFVEGVYLSFCDFTHPFTAITPTYKPMAVPRNIKKCLPPVIHKGIADGIRAFSQQLKGFDMPDAVLTAVESRTSAPVRINRTESGEASRCLGLYPVGEGAGYAGGIVSAAVDGIRAAERLISIYKPQS